LLDSSYEEKHLFLAAKLQIGTITFKS